MVKPADLAAEEIMMVVCAVPEIIHQVLEYTKPECFSNPVHRGLLEVMADLVSEHDSGTVTKPQIMSAIAKQGLGIEPYLALFDKHTEPRVKATRVEQNALPENARRVTEDYELRKVASYCSDLVEQARRPEAQMDQVFEQYMAGVNSLPLDFGTNNSLYQLGQSAVRTYDILPLGIEWLDVLIGGGMDAGHLLVINAPIKAGKSKLLRYILCQLMKSGVDWDLFQAADHRKEEIYEEFVAMIAAEMLFKQYYGEMEAEKFDKLSRGCTRKQVHQWRYFLYHNEWPPNTWVPNEVVMGAFAVAKRRIGELSEPTRYQVFDDKLRDTDIAFQIRRDVYQRGIKFWAVDYGQKIHSKGNEFHMRMRNFVSSMSEVAVSTGTRGIIVSQVTKSGTNSSDLNYAPDSFGGAALSEAANTALTVRKLGPMQMDVFVHLARDGESRVGGEMLFHYPSGYCDPQNYQLYRIDGGDKIYDVHLDDFRLH